MKKKKLTIVVPTYNHEKFIDKCILSILKQKINFNYEIIILDDASQDKTVQKVKKYLNQNIKLLKNSTNQFNKNFKEIGYNKLFFISKKVSSKYIAVLEGDDAWIDNKKIQKQIQILEKKKLDCVYSYYYTKKIGSQKKLETNKFHISTTLFKRKSLIKIFKPYEKKVIPWPGDFLIKTLMDEHCSILKMKEPTMLANIHKNNSESLKSLFDKNVQAIKIINYLLKNENFKKIRLEILYLKLNSYIDILKKKKFLFIVVNFFDFFKTMLEIKILKKAIE